MEKREKNLPTFTNREISAYRGRYTRPIESDRGFDIVIAPLDLHRAEVVQGVGNEEEQNYRGPLESDALRDRDEVLSQREEGDVRDETIQHQKRKMLELFDKRSTDQWVQKALKKQDHKNGYESEDTINYAYITRKSRPGIGKMGSVILV